MINQACNDINVNKTYSDMYKYTLQCLVDNLKSLKSAHIEGHGSKALASFFDLYVFNKDE